MKKCKLLITDLDGTLIETVSGDTFPKGIWDMKLKLYVFEAIKNYAPDDILIISNQGGIEKGFVDKEMFEYKFDYISNALEDYTWEYKNSQSNCLKQLTGYFFLSYHISYLPLSKYQLASSPDSSLFLPPKKNPIVMPLVINQ